MADVAFGHRAAPHTLPTTMDLPSQWHYVAIRLMAQLGTYSPDEKNRLHWLWHQRTALCVRPAMQRHNIWTNPWSLSSRGHASGHQRPQSQEVLEPPRQTARHDSPRRHKGPPSGVCFPLGTHGSRLRPFAPRWDQGSPHAPEMKGGAPASRTPDRHQEARNPVRSRRRSRTPPPAARPVVFHEGGDRGSGAPSDPPARQTSPAADPRRRSKRPRTEGTQVPTIPTPAERAGQAAPQPGPHQAQDGASSSSAASAPASPASLPPGGRKVADARPKGPAADQQPEQGAGGRTAQSPPPPRTPGVTAPAPDMGTGHPTNRANAPPGSPPWL